MNASVDGKVVAQSDDAVAVRGYQYFSQTAVRADLLPKTERTAADLKCPHAVQFYDVVVDGKRHKRAAPQYEKPRPEITEVRDCFGFWQDVKVA